MEKNDSPLESNKAYGEMLWVFFHRHVTNYLPFLDRRIRLPTYDLLGPTCAKHTELNKKELDYFLREKEIHFSGENVHRDTDYYVSVCQTGTGHRSKSRKH